MKKNKIQINISNRGIYTLIVSVILIIAAVVVHAALAPGVVPNPGHDVSQISGACASSGNGCFFLGNYYNRSEVYSKQEVDSKIESITGVCTWDGWLYKSCNRCIVPDCEMFLNQCSDKMNQLCLTEYPDTCCTADYVEDYYCSNGAITDHKWHYTNCRLIYVPSGSAPV